MFKKKKTNNENVFNEHELKTIKETIREHTELDDFIEWLNKKCFLEKWQICGIRKIKYDESRNCYIGFLLNNRFTDKPERNYDFTIYGFLSCDPHHTPVYRAHLKEQLSERPIGITKQLFLSENGIDLTEYWNKGIGSVGLDIIKELAKHLHCSCIYGRKVPLKDTEEEMDKLTHFYRKNGFANAADGEHILYDMHQYKSRYEKKITEQTGR